MLVKCKFSMLCKNLKAHVTYQSPENDTTPFNVLNSVERDSRYQDLRLRAVDAL